MSSIKRKPHALRREKTLTIPRHVIFFDTETDQIPMPDGSIVQKLKLGWTVYYRRATPGRKEKLTWLEFKTADQFWSFIDLHTTKKNKLWVIAHNLSFDFTVVEGFRHLHKESYKCKFFYSAGITTLIKVAKPGFSIMFVDSLNWFRESVDEIGKRIGLPKLKVDFDSVSDSDLSVYCRRDVEILLNIYKQLAAFLENNRISRLAPTIGSVAYAAYLFRHYHTKIYIHNNEQAIDLERASYKGGRTECFYIGELKNGPYYCLDVNSLYPYVMSSNWYPVKYKKIVHNIEKTRLAGLLENYAVIAKVILHTENPVYAVKTKRTIFPIGRFTVVLSTPELLYAIDKGNIESVKTAVIYDRAKIFTSFVNRFYKLRRQFADENNSLFEHFCKIIMNSLYGKFGQKAQTWKKIGNCKNEIDRIEDIYDHVTRRTRQIRYLLDEVFELVDVGESRHSFPAIASHVTAYARMYLWSLMEKCGRENYYYCDTDSLFVNTTGMNRLKRLIHTSKLGRLKIEYKTDRLKIYGLKDYITDHKTVIKGIRNTAVKISDMDYEQDRWPSIKGLLRGGSPNLYAISRTHKHLTRDYTKGVIQVDGLIRPFVFDGSAEQSEPLFEPPF